MEQEVLVSVVLVCYNQQDYIEQALNSVLIQKTDFSFEIVIGDDGSQDNTPKILRDYAKKYPDLIRLTLREQNLGATRNVYELMQMCKGDFIAYLEGDDYWTDEFKLQKQADFLRTHQEFFGCTSDFKIISSKGEELLHYRLEWLKPKTRFSIKDYDGYHLPSQSSTYFRRNIYKTPKFDYTVMYKADRTIGDRISTPVYLMHGDYYRFKDKMTAYRLPDSGRICGTNIVYSDTVNALTTDLRLYRYARSFLHAMDAPPIGDYAARRIYYSALAKYIKTGNGNFAEIMKDAMQLTSGRLKTLALLPLYVIHKLYFKWCNHWYKML